MAVLPQTLTIVATGSGLTVSFSCGNDGAWEQYSWDFGDGHTSHGWNPTNTYATGGTYTVTVSTRGNASSESANGYGSATYTISAGGGCR